MAALVRIGTGNATRLSPDPQLAGGQLKWKIPADPTLAGLPAGTRLSADPATAEAQIIAGLNILA